MIILGIDPGYAILGYGVLLLEGSNFSVIDYGVIETKSDMPFPKRLSRLYEGTRALIEKYSPDCVSFEELFFARNTKTALQVAAGRGVSILAAEECGLPLYEYTPMQIKLAVCGNGHADKHQIMETVKMLLHLKLRPKPDDAADGLAAAICHASTMKICAEEFIIK
ncbi:MAG: crossover junction endodeoxyribonuclease RuvC [Clostridia bacterium]